MERLFIIIGRINSVLFLLVLLGAGVSIGFYAWSSAQWQRRGTVEVPTEESPAATPVLLRFEHIENIPGTNTQMMLLCTEDRSAKFSSGYGSETRNVLFLTGEEKKARWLFSKQNNLILVATQLLENTKGLESKTKATKALYFEYVTNDTNGDGKLSVQDLSNIALSRPNGMEFVEILHGVSRVLSYEMLDSQYLSVVYQIGKTVRHAKVSVLSLITEADQEIVSVPEVL